MITQRRRELKAFRAVLQSIKALQFVKLYEYVGSGNKVLPPADPWVIDGDP